MIGFNILIIFTQRLRPLKIEIIIFSYHKNVHFAWTTVQILHKNQIPIKPPYFLWKVCTVVLENWVFLWLQKLIISISMGQNLNRKIIFT